MRITIDFYEHGKLKEGFEAFFKITFHYSNGDRLTTTAKQLDEKTMTELIAEHGEDRCS